MLEMPEATKQKWIKAEAAALDIIIEALELGDVTEDIVKVASHTISSCAKTRGTETASDAIIMSTVVTFASEKEQDTYWKATQPKIMKTIAGKVA